MVDVLDPFPAVTVDGVEILIDQTRPVAALRRSGVAPRFVTWSEVDLPPVEPIVRMLPGPDGAWVYYFPPTAELTDTGAKRSAAGTSRAVHISPDGQVHVLDTGNRLVIGATTGMLWSTDAVTQVLDDDYDGRPLPEGWSEWTSLWLQDLLGSQTQIRVDRHVLAVLQSDERILIVVAPSPPIATRDRMRSVTYDYRVTEIALPAGQPVPSTIRFRDFISAGFGPEPTSTYRWWNAEPADQESDTRIDLTEVPDTYWPMAQLTQRQKATAIEAAANWFGDPERFWKAEDGTVSPLTRGVSDAKVHTQGAWPDTQVTVTFNYPTYPGVRLRRSLRVFDSTGRIISSQPYAAIELMEDLDTGALPKLEHARDGYLDI